MSIEYFHQDSAELHNSFALDKAFVAQYAERAPPFGFAGLSEFTYMRTYSRVKADGTKELWYETVERVVNGTYQMQQDHILAANTGWNSAKAQESAQEMYDLMYNLKFTPPGRGLWAMGSPITDRRKLYAALNNCGFTTTRNLAEEFSEPFAFLMDMSMLGVGIGFDTEGAGLVSIRDLTTGEIGPNHHKPELMSHEPERVLQNYKTYLQKHIEETHKKVAVESNEWTRAALTNDLNQYRKEFEYISNLNAADIIAYHIPDTREGWVESVSILIDSFLRPDMGNRPVVHDYSGIREKGLLLKTFGGKSSGPEPLVDLNIAIRHIMHEGAGSPITITQIVDIMNLIGRCVIAGNVRRSSEIAIGPYNEEFIDLKNYSKNPHRAAYGWCSNNSIIGTRGMDYSDIAERIRLNGEPGIFWLENARIYGRMGREPDYKDMRALGCNPCAEQTLEDKELCCLVEVYPSRHANKEEFLRTLKFAYLYAKTVTLGRLHWPKTNAVMSRNRRIGCSLTGIADFLVDHSLEDLRNWCDTGYDIIQAWDNIYSDWLAVPRSIKTTSIKPSGCVSANTRIPIRVNGAEQVMTMAEIFGYCEKTIDPIATFKDVQDKNLEVINASGEWEQLTRLFCRGNQQMYEVPLEEGIVYCTGDHRFKLTNGEWRRAMDLQADDDIAVV